MKILFLINAAIELEAHMSTTLLMAAAARKHEVSVCGIDDFVFAGGTAQAWARRLDLPPDDITQERISDMVRQQQPSSVALHSFDVIMVRTNPGRDAERRASHAIAMDFLCRGQDNNILIVNDPAGLTRAATKAYLANLPAGTVPELLVSRNPKEIEAWAHALGDSVVLKPVSGTRGNDVFAVHPPDWSNVRQMIQVVTRHGYAIAQRFIPEARHGDTRVLVVGGDILEVDGHVAAVTRVPAQGDFRSNIHAGGSAKAGVVTDGMRAVVSRIGKQLVNDGLLIVGLDFIADQIIEVNVFSPGGFGNAMEQQKRDFAMAVVDKLTTWARPA